MTARARVKGRLVIGLPRELWLRSARGECASSVVEEVAQRGSRLGHRTPESLVDKGKTGR